jgi:hypothetical protein
MKDLLGGDVRILRGVAPPPDRPGQPRYEIFHDVLAPSILDWRTRFAQAEERAAADKKLAIETEERVRTERQRNRERVLRFSLIGMAILILAVIATAAFYVQGNRAKAEAAEARNLLMENQRIIALERQYEVEKQRKVAEAAKENAEKLQKQAEENAEKANKAKDEAKKQRDKASEQEAIAKRALAETIQAKRDVVRESIEAKKQRDAAIKARQELERQVQINEIVQEDQNLSVSARNLLSAIRMELNDAATKDVATTKLQKIVAALEKDTEIAALLKDANVSSQDTDGGKLRAALVDIRRKVAQSNNQGLLDKVNQAIVDIVNGGTVRPTRTTVYAGDFDSLQALRLA